MKITMTIRLNGTGENPWHKMNLTQNPFPQVGKMEYMAGQMALNSLDGDPLTGTDDIKKRLKGKVSDELIALCCRHFMPGQRISFQIYFEENS